MRVEGITIRLMETADTSYFPQIKSEFKENGHHGDYFFFVILDVNQQIVGCFVAKKKEVKVLIKKFYFLDDVKEEDKRTFKNAAFSNLYEYIKCIKSCDGKRVFYQVSIV